MWLSAELAAFARVVELGSFTAAARALGVPKVALSRALKALEARTGTRLLERTTRRVTLTDAGRALLPWSQRIAAETDAVRRAISRQSGTRPGLRVLADSAWGRLLLTPLVPRFLERHASIPLEVALLAELPVTAAPDWDVLIQNGQPGAGLVATALGAPPVILCATPAWLQAHGTPLRPADLPRDALLIAGTAVDSLRLKRGHETALLPISPRLAINDPAVVHAATAAGAGTARCPNSSAARAWRWAGSCACCRTGLPPTWSSCTRPAICSRGDRKCVLIDFLVANMVPVGSGRTGGDERHARDGAARDRPAAGGRAASAARSRPRPGARARTPARMPHGPARRRRRTARRAAAIIPGHEIAGAVDAVGPGCRLGEGARVGIPGSAGPAASATTAAAAARTCATRHASPATRSTAATPNTRSRTNATACHCRTLSTMRTPRRCCAPGSSAIAHCGPRARESASVSMASAPRRTSSRRSRCTRAANSPRSRARATRRRRTSRVPSACNGPDPAPRRRRGRWTRRSSSPRWARWCRRRCARCARAGAWSAPAST
jgi:DNA-binding transcriptional LysR family regulator